MSDQSSTRTLADIIADFRKITSRTVSSICTEGLLEDHLAAEALEEIDRRLRVLEPCQATGDPHLWSARKADGSRLEHGDHSDSVSFRVCAFCGVRR